MKTAPGSTKAQCQPMRAATSAVTTGASATPILPKAPLMPTARPILPLGEAAAASTSMAVPTGW